MFDVGFQELVLLFIIGLLVLGPQRLPKVAAEIGKWVGRARRTATQLRRQLEREIELADLEGTQQQSPAPPAQPQPPVPEQNPFVASEAATPPVEPPAESPIVESSVPSPATEAPASPESAPDKPPHA